MYYVVQVEPTTGILLAEDGTRASGNEHWYAFASLEAAEAYCARRLSESPHTEWAVFGEDRVKAIRRIIDDAYWTEFSKTAARPSLWQRIRARFNF